MGATGQLLFDEVPLHQPLDAAQATSLCADIEAELSPQAQPIHRGLLTDADLQQERAHARRRRRVGRAANVPDRLPDTG